MVDAILSGSGVTGLIFIVQLLRTGFRDIRVDLSAVRNDIGDLRERVARLEGREQCPHTPMRN